MLVQVNQLWVETWPPDTATFGEFDGELCVERPSEGARARVCVCVSIPVPKGQCTNRSGAERTRKALLNEALRTCPRKRELITPVYLQTLKLSFLNC